MPLKRFCAPVALFFAFCLALPGVSAAAEVGGASWYAMTSITASGERANPNALTAAHRRLPFGTRVKVTNLRNGKSIVVRINDRGPFIKGRIIDVTRAGAVALGFKARGHTRVRVQRVSRKTSLGAQPRWQPLAKLTRVALPKRRPVTVSAGLRNTGI